MLRDSEKLHYSREQGLQEGTKAIPTDTAAGACQDGVGWPPREKDFCLTPDAAWECRLQSCAKGSHLEQLCSAERTLSLSLAP